MRVAFRGVVCRLMFRLPVGPVLTSGLGLRRYAMSCFTVGRVGVAGLRLMLTWFVMLRYDHLIGMVLAVSVVRGAGLRCVLIVRRLLVLLIR